ncbi:MAG: chemotaxis protein CheX [Magnetococcales bacterium]|nr:chemotaxis protein CheX [Magnetococcales bacterium]
MTQSKWPLNGDLYRQKVLDDLKNSTIEVLATMAMVEASLIDSREKAVFSLSGPVGGLIHLTGSGEGVFQEGMFGIAGEVGLISDLVARIVGLDAGELTKEDLLDGVAELANMICGGMKSKGGIGPGRLSPPMAALGDGMLLLWKTSKPTRLMRFQMAAGVLEVHASV